MSIGSRTTASPKPTSIWSRTRALPRRDRSAGRLWTGDLAGMELLTGAPRSIRTPPRSPTRSPHRGALTVHLNSTKASFWSQGTTLRDDQGDHKGNIRLLLSVVMCCKCLL